MTRKAASSWAAQQPPPWVHDDYLGPGFYLDLFTDEPPQIDWCGLQYEYWSNLHLSSDAVAARSLRVSNWREVGRELG